MNFKKLKSQSGRSMVEMLGVLAIIGVLSVGGIAGYSLSMRRHRANGVVDLVSKYALVAYNFCHQWLESGNSDWEDIGECSGNNALPSFSEAGLGNLPAGVRFITFYGMNQADYINSGVESMHMMIFFTDEKLCQATASIAGNPCRKSGSEYTLDINIKQN